MDCLTTEKIKNEPRTATDETEFTFTWDSFPLGCSDYCEKVINEFALQDAIIDCSASERGAGIHFNQPGL